MRWTYLISNIFAFIIQNFLQTKQSVICENSTVFQNGILEHPLETLKFPEGALRRILEGM